MYYNISAHYCGLRSAKVKLGFKVRSFEVIGAKRFVKLEIWANTRSKTVP